MQVKHAAYHNNLPWWRSRACTDHGTLRKSWARCHPPAVTSAWGADQVERNGFSIPKAMVPRLLWTGYWRQHSCPARCVGLAGLPMPYSERPGGKSSLLCMLVPRCLQALVGPLSRHTYLQPLTVLDALDVRGKDCTNLIYSPPLLSPNTYYTWCNVS